MKKQRTGCPAIKTNAGDGHGQIRVGEAVVLQYEQDDAGIPSAVLRIGESLWIDSGALGIRLA
jgi:hypothetical protein